MLTLRWHLDFQNVSRGKQKMHVLNQNFDQHSIDIGTVVEASRVVREYEEK